MVIKLNKKLGLQERIARVQQVWNAIEETNSEISREKLLSLVAEITKEDYGNVAALYQGENPD